MKRFCVILIAFMLAIPAFAQEDWDEQQQMSATKNWSGQRQMAVTVNPLPLVIGLPFGGFGIEAGFEFAPIKHFSMKANAFYLGFSTGDFNALEFGLHSYILRISLEGRWYPGENYLQGFFVNGGLHFHRLGASISISGESASGGLNTIGIFSGIGYKMVFGKSRTAFALEPKLDFTWPLYSQIPLNEMGAAAGNVLGWILGLRLFRVGIVFGVAF